MTDINFLTPKELSQRWGFCENTLATWRRRNIGPEFKKRGFKKVIYPMDALIAFEAQNPGFLLKK